jgi:hypothetical protein
VCQERGIDDGGERGKRPTNRHCTVMVPTMPGWIEQ